MSASIKALAVGLSAYKSLPKVGVVLLLLGLILAPALLGAVLLEPL